MLSLYFDVVVEGYRGWWIVFASGAPGVLAGCLFLFGPKWFPAPNPRRLLGVILLIAGCAIGVDMFVTTFREYTLLKNRLLSGEYGSVEGVVSDFAPGTADGHRSESFRVGEHHYSYSRAEITMAFHHVRGAGGPLTAGMMVRIADVDGKIARLEIKRSTTP